jgi:ribosomal-protein-alanine N-acetyltransferase
MAWTFVPMNATHATAITTWRYEPPYDLYDAGDDISGFLRPEYHYYAVMDESGNLAGFCCYGPDARVPGGDYPDDGSLDIGAGLRPDLTGGGRGHDFLSAVLDVGRCKFAPGAFRATVAAFNLRSLRMCERAGFRQVQHFTSLGTGVRFIVLHRPEGPPEVAMQ